MEKEPTSNIIYTCSFCGKRYDKVKHLIAGPNHIYICDECVEMCNTILAQRGLPIGNNQPIQNIQTPYPPARLNADKAIRNVQETMQDVMADISPNDPHYQQLKQAFDGSLQRLQNMKRTPTSPKETSNTAQLSESYTDTLRLAAVEKRRLTDPAIDTTHLLLALLRLPSGNASRVFDILDINRDQLIQKVEAVHSRRETNNYDENQNAFIRLSGMTPAADQATAFAYAESHTLQSPSIGAEHLLLGLLHIENDPNIEVFKQAGLRLDQTSQIVSSISN